MFQVLLSRISIGESLESAFAIASREVKATCGARSPVSIALRGLTSDLESRTPFIQAMARFSRKLRCKEAEMIFMSLASARFVGSGILELIRAGQRILAESISLLDDVESETAQRRIESMAIAAMPPIVAALLRQFAPEYLAPVLATTAGNWVLTGMYLMSALSIALVLRMLAGPSGPVASHRPRLRQRESPAFMAKLGEPFLRFLPAVYRSRLSRALYPTGRPSMDNIQAYIGKKLLLAASGAVAGTGLRLAGASWVWIPFLVVLLPVFQDKDLFHGSSRFQTGLLHAFPMFLALMAAILQAVISLANALDLCADSMPDTDGPLRQELTEIQAGKRAGRPVSAGFDQLASRVTAPEVQSSLSLIAQYERTGGRELVSLLQMQVPACWAIYRHALRKQMEETAALLLIPMMLDLASVIVIAGYPAMRAFQG